MRYDDKLTVMLKLRPYKRSDAQIIASWITSEQEFYEWSAGILGDYPLAPGSLNEFADKIAEDESCYQMVAAGNDGPVGYLTLRYPTDDRTHVRIGFVLVDPAKRGAGHGVSMIGLALKYAFELLKVDRVTLSVFEENRHAYKTYRSAGFMETGNTETYEIRGTKHKSLELEILADAKKQGPSNHTVPEDEYIRSIIDNNRLSYAFQPIVDASTGEIFAYEALMRADYDGAVTPISILDYATREDRLYDIEKLTLFNVMELYSGNRELFGNRKIFINSIPGWQLTEEDYGDFHSRYHELFSNMVLEITESTEFKDNELSVLLERSARDGFELAIDDFGTGYSNTSSLLSYLPNYLKIDRLLIANIHEENKKQHFVKSIMEFASANGVRTLAEGVETSAELKTVMELGASLIQGYYTAKPSLEIVDTIDEDIRNEIISSSVKGTNQEMRKIYSLNGEKELPIMRLALEKYTGILIDQEEFSLVGNTRYSAEMSIKIKDGVKCRLSIRDVFMESTQQLPCIELGTGSELTLVLYGENRILKYGILVPETSKLTIEGPGNLQIRSQGVSSFAIGNFWNAKVGDITWKGEGSLDILVEADEGIGIGGGEFKKGNGIHLLSGMTRIEPASGRAIAMGAAKGKIPIRVSDCKLQLDIKIDKGIGIGCMSGTQDTVISNSNVNIMCAGSTISAIGSTEKTSGTVLVESSELSILANGQKLYLVGAKTGEMDIQFTDSAINLRGEGNTVLGIGTSDLKSKITARKTICNIKLASGSPTVYGAKPEDILYAGGLQTVSVNE